jgi:hypothetical protein
MSQLLLDVQPPVQALPRRPRPLPIRLTFAVLPSGYVPGRGLLVSVLFHGILFLGVIFSVHRLSRQVEVHPLALSASERKEVIYLPVLGGGQEGDGHAGGGSGLASKVLAQIPAHSSKGLSYPGKQPILSDPPNPLNLNQTLLRPGLKNLPILQKFVRLPNLVQSENVAPVQPLDVRGNKSSLPKSHAETAAIAPPKLKLPASAPLELAENNPALPTLHQDPPPELPKLNLPVQVREAATLPSTVAQPPRPAEKIAKVIDAPKLEQMPVSQMAARGMDRQNLVALSPMPAPPDEAVKIPMAETRGRFAVSAIATTAAATPDPGSKSEGSSTKAGIGSNSSAPTGNAAAQVAVGGGKGDRNPSGGGGTGVGTGTGNAVGSGHGGTGAGSGHGSNSGPALGTGVGVTAGGGTGEGSGHGSGHFPGITIQGGRLEGGGTAAKVQGATPVLAQSSYGMTIVSTASSGGGLADYGVFSNEKVYTVYLDARNTTADPATAWTLQYAPIQSQTAAATGASIGPNLKGLTPPYALVKQIPDLPAEVLRRYPQRVVVVCGIINSDGKMEQMLVVQSPDDRLTERVTEALNKWLFRPAQLNGHPISIKVMLGIPLARFE